LAQGKKNYMKILITNITSPNTMMPITFTGQNTEVIDYANKY